MNPTVSFYMDLQASNYRRSLSRSISTEANNGKRTNTKDTVCVVPRANIYSRSISVRNGATTNGMMNGASSLSVNGSLQGQSPNNLQKPTCTSQDGRQRILMTQRSVEPNLECNPLINGMMLKEAGFFFGNGVPSLLLDNEDTVYSEFTKCHKCYDLIPTSTKLVVFDIMMSVKKAFYALVENGVRGAPLWDNVRQQYVGLLTITDFIHILRRYYKAGVSSIKEIEEHRIASWREVLGKDHVFKPFLTMDAKESLYDAVQTLYDNKVHRLPIVDKTSGNVLYILTYKKIFRFLYGYIQDLPAPSFLQRTPKELGIGSWENVWTVKHDTRLIDVLSCFLDKRVSSLPVVDQSERLVDIYAKADVFDLAVDKSYSNLGITIMEALTLRSDKTRNLRICNEYDSLATIMKVLFEQKAHRVVIANDQLRVLGIVSLSDVLAFLILRPQGDPVKRI